jgi:hypothetical protein
MEETLRMMFFLNVFNRYLTNGMPGLERFMISFKSCFSGHYHRHVVLGLYYSGKFGAIGMSRRDDLMYKPLSYNVSTSTENGYSGSVGFVSLKIIFYHSLNII